MSQLNADQSAEAQTGRAMDHPAWRKIAAFKFDGPETRLTFARRLARENGWTISFAERVIEEYRRFLFLTQAAGHPVTPSDEVDQAWHLHLVYTRSYWEDMCANVLDRPLHHGPTRGGASEDAKFEVWYARTLASYHEWFGVAPPEDIWPKAAVRFGRAASFRRVSLQDVWLIPRRRTTRFAAALAVLATSLVTTGFLVEISEAGWIIIAVGILLLIVIPLIFWAIARGGRKGGHGGSSGCGGAAGSGNDSGCGSSGCGGGGCGGGCGS